MMRRISSSMRGKSSSLQRRRHVDVVVKAVLDGRPERQLDAGEQPHHRTGHDVRTAMAQNVQRFAVFVGEDLEGERARHLPSPQPKRERVWVRGRQFTIEVDNGAVDLGRNRRLG